MPKNMLATKAKDPTHAIMGVDTEGHPLSIPLSDGPHWLCAGQTGSGKSVFVNSILISMMFHAHPDELKITWIDPKKVEAKAYVGLPFCPIDPVTNMDDASGLLKYLTWEMDQRYDKLESVDVKKIDEFNQWVEDNPQEAQSKGYTKFPYWILVIDEYYDMILQNKSVEDDIVRIAQKARAAGIHMIVATQRPSADVISSTVKANIPARIAMKVMNAVNSNIILDEPGAEELRGYGDAYIKEVSGDVSRVQGPFITNDEIARIFGALTQEYGKYNGADGPFDYKTRTVDLGLCDWADEYTDDVPLSDRHVKPKKKTRGFSL